MLTEATSGPGPSRKGEKKKKKEQRLIILDALPVSVMYVSGREEADVTAKRGGRRR